MKNILFAIALLIQLVCYSYPKIESYKTTEKFLYGFVNGKKVDLYLEKVTNSDCVYGIYTVKGWYQVLGSELKIELVGLCYWGELYLYRFKDANMKNEFLAFEYLQGLSMFERYEAYKDLTEFDEKISINMNSNWEQKCFWQKESALINIETYGELDTDIEKSYYFLCLNKEKAIDLIDVVYLLEPRYKLLCYKHDLSKFVLEYSALSRANVCGQCGAGDNIGLIELTFDDNLKLLNVKRTIISNCDASIFINEKKVYSDKIIYKLIRENNKKYRVEVDLKNTTVMNSKEL